MVLKINEKLEYIFACFSFLGLYLRHGEMEQISFAYMEKLAFAVETSVANAHRDPRSRPLLHSFSGH